ncbi:MAG: hypothetical protein R6X02_29775 [Enhygromyxa sp.]
MLASPVTAGRMELVWRLFGFVLVLLWIQHMHTDSLFAFVERSAAALDGIGLCGLLLLIVGPSLPVLIASAAVGVWFLIAVLARQPTLEFMADEYVIQAGLPIVAAIVSVAHLVARRRRPLAVDLRLREELDELHARVFRIFAVTTLALAGLHKLNSDFFAAGSCAKLGSRLHEWWELPFEIPVAGPLGVVTLELLAALMLLVYPRIGILLVVYVMAGLGHIGPAAFASTCAVISLAFLDRGDAVVLRSEAARRWGLPVALGLIVTATSYSTYRSPLAWIKYGLLELVLIVVACSAIATGVARLRRKPGLRRRLVPAALRWRRRPATVMPGLTSWLALVLLFNGMSPYLGIKYRFSVAMLSNLRVDQERWNSYVVPEWVRLRSTTPHVVVDWQPVGRWTPVGKRGQHLLGDGLMSGAALLSALEDAMRRRARGRLRVSYRGQQQEFELPADYLLARSWIEQLPPALLWQQQLGPGDQPQACTH